MQRVEISKNIRVRALIGSLFLLSGIYSFIISAPSVSALSDWNPGNIMSDTVFADKGTMNAAQIQSFLESKVPNCDTQGDQTSEFGGGTRRQWAEARGYNPPYTCLRDYIEGGKKASSIIFDAAQEFAINPRVLIVLLQKEQGLVTDNWPLPTQYRTATGYGCPDTASCDSQYYGLTNQIRWSAKMFRAILDASPTWYTPYLLGTNYIRYNPDASCGGTNVYIQNRATQALYNYTPYQPNQGALDAGYGTAYCGAYGNRNFYLYFTNWFGSTTGYIPLDTPRWMVIKNDTTKVNPSTNDSDGVQLSAGIQLKFTSKVFARGAWYLRTEYDTSNKNDRAIPVGDIGEISYVPLDTPVVMRTNTLTQKRNPFTGQVYTNETLQVGTQVRLSGKIQVNGSWYYRTVFDEQNSVNSVVPASALEDIPYQNFEIPRYMKVARNTTKVNPATGVSSGPVITSDTQYKFTSKVFVGDTWYYRTDTDTSGNTLLAINSKDVSDIPFVSMTPKWQQTTAVASKYNPSTGLTTDPAIPAGMPLRLVDQTIVNGTLYYRTTYDSNFGHNKAIPASSFGNIPFIPMEKPRTMVLVRNTKKRDPATGAEIESILAAGTQLRFETKVIIGGQVFLRTSFDTSSGLYKGILMTDVR